jgi:hypothetical protein
MQKTTLRELGSQMPVGIEAADGTLMKSFKLRPFRMKEEKELARLKERPGLNAAKYASMVVAAMLTEIGGRQMDGMTESAREALISNLTVGDVLYIYTFLRAEALGSEVRMRVPCGKCKEHFDFLGDLTTIEVRTVDKPGEMVRHFEMAHGIPYRGQTRKKVTLRPIRWSIFETTDLKNAVMLRAAALQNAIVGIEGIPDAEFSPIPDTSLDELTKRDMEMLERAAEMNSPGPLMAVEAKCPKCRTSWAGPIDWGYDSFFSHSSL